MTGPVSRYIADRFSAVREKVGTYDEISVKSGVKKTTVVRACQGDTGLAVETFVPLAMALGFNPGQLLDEAQLAVYGTPATAPSRDWFAKAAYIDPDPTEDERIRQEHPDDEVS